jgi:hypothetical protein
MQLFSTIKAQLFPKQRVTVDTIVQQFNSAVEQLNVVAEREQASADAAASMIVELEAQRVASIKEAGRALNVAQKIKALVE